MTDIDIKTEDYSKHDETVVPVKERGYGRGASLHDRADRGALNALLEHPMPVPPQGDLERGAYDYLNKK